jgi:cytidine deaminase
MSEGRRGGLVAVAIVGGSAERKPGDVQAPVTPCGRCRQVLAELASLDRADPVVWCGGGEEVLELRLSVLLPYGFGKDNLQG